MKPIIIAVIVAVLIVGGAYIFTTNNKGTQQVVNVNNVTLVDGKQIIEIQAKGGYLPRKSVAKVGIPTVLRFNTNGTFDCSSSVRIPSMDISKNLPPSQVLYQRKTPPRPPSKIRKCPMTWMRLLPKKQKK
jgi:plastocyanin domain-containing protein